MSKPPFQSNRWWYAAEAVLGLALVCLPLAIGGATDWSLWLLMGLSLLATVCWLVGARLHQRRWAWHPVLGLPLAVLALELVQVVPLPPFLLSWLSPHAADLRENALVPMGLTDWRPVTLDVTSTLRALARTVALGGLVFTAAQVGRSEHARRRLISVVGAMGGLIATIGFIHLLAGLDTLFGMYRFVATTPMMSPFGNSNHLAAFLTVCSTIALGLALQAKRRDSAIGWGVMAVMMGVATFLSLSRGGIASLVVTWGLVAAYVASRRTGGLRGAFPWLAIAAVIVGAGLLAFEQLQTRANSVATLERLGSTKLELWPMFAKAAGAFWPLGMGVGAFELAFSPWQTSQFEVTFTHPEDVALQWFAEAGLPFSLGLLALAAYVVRRLWRDSQHLRVEAVALLGVLGLLIHDVLDFALELNAVPAIAAVVLGLVASVAPEAVSGRRLVKLRAFGAVAVAAVIALVCATSARPSHLVDERTLQAAIGDPEALPTVPAMAKAALDRHPADWVLYAAMAEVSATHGSAQNALAWVNRWLWLRPSDAHAHIAAAQALLRLHQRTQALLEFRTAFELGERSERVMDVALAIASTEHDYERLFIDQPGWLESAWNTLGRRTPAEAEVLLARALENPISQTMKLEAQVLRVRSLEAKGDLAAAVRLLESLPPEQREASVLVRARMMAKLGRADEAAALLEQRTLQAPSSVETAYALADVLAGAGKTGAARQVLERVQPYVGDPAIRSTLFQKIAALWSADARHAKALDAWVTASRLEPGRPDLHYRVAQAYEQLGSYISAIDEVKKGRSLDTTAGAQAQQPWLDKLEATAANRTH